MGRKKKTEAVINDIKRKTRRRNHIILFLLFVTLFGAILYYNLTSYSRIIQNTGYAYGEIIEVFQHSRSRSYYSRYRFEYDDEIYIGKQGGKYTVGSVVIIAYDQETPFYSMIAEYSGIIITSQGDTNPIDTNLIHLEWSEYLPHDELIPLD